MKLAALLGGLATTVILVCAAVAPARAHHSYGATYDVSREVKVEGTLVQFIFRNPHTFVHVQAPDADGTMQRWAIEWSGTAQLANNGITRDTLHVGDAVVIVGRPSRVPGEFRVLMVSLKRPSDGFTWGTKQGEAVD
jgi:DNA/RNA endonuclease YhcR with UshA esterase domain